MKSKEELPVNEETLQFLQFQVEALQRELERLNKVIQDGKNMEEILRKTTKEYTNVKVCVFLN